MSCCGGSGVVGLCGQCGCQPCSCNYNVIINPPGGGGGTYAATNINLSGIGVYDSQSGNTFQFRGIDSASAALTVSLNATNHTIVLSLDLAAITAAIPQATPTVAGIGETAIDAEALAKASTTVFITPSNFAAMGASDSFAGFVEFATNAEAITGTSTTLGLTPANLTAVLATVGSTVTFADAATRAGTAPAFSGQFGAQQDNTTAWLGIVAAAPGSWRPIFVGEETTTLSGGSSTIISVQPTADIQFNGNNSCSFTLTGGIPLNIDGGGFAISNVVLPNVIVGNDGAGAATNYPLVNFISQANTQGSYVLTNPSTSRSLDIANATLAQLRNFVGTFVQDIINNKLPVV